MDKNDIRRSIAAHKTLLDESERQEAADRLFERLERLAAFMMADNILVYHSLPDELPTHRFIDKWASTKRFYLPRVNGVELEILPYDKSRMHLGSFHIEEPDGDDIVSIDNIEMIVVPGIAFDRHGHRVGRGKGYYDRMLGNSDAIKVGVGYDFQFVDEFIVDPHDVDMDIIITDQRCVMVRHH